MRLLHLDAVQVLLALDAHAVLGVEAAALAAHSVHRVLVSRLVQVFLVGKEQTGFLYFSLSYELNFSCVCEKEWVRASEREIGALG